jgi:hypothetical protein
MHKAIDPDYYGFRDEEDGVLEPLEAEAEKNMRAQVGRGGVLLVHINAWRASRINLYFVKSFTDKCCGHSSHSGLLNMDLVLCTLRYTGSA